MPVRRKSFKAGTKIADFDPVEFEFGDQTFHCKPAVQGSVLLDFVAKADSDSGGESAAAIYDFFYDVMEEEEYGKFRAYLKNSDTIFTMEEIGEIVSWLVEEYSSRPTKGSSTSPNGQSTSGLTSTDRESSSE